MTVTIVLLVIQFHFNVVIIFTTFIFITRAEELVLWEKHLLTGMEKHSVLSFVYPFKKAVSGISNF